jgi:hypothetical protein
MTGHYMLHSGVDGVGPYRIRSAQGAQLICS